MLGFKKSKKCFFSLSFRKMVITKWIKRFLSKHIVQIIKGNLNRLLGRNLKLYNLRYFYCKDCRQKRYNSVIGEYCNICGCPLKSKLRAKDEHCDLNKW